MGSKLKYFFSPRSGLLALAVIIFFLSWIFNKYYTKGSSIAREKKLLTNYIHKQQDDFDKIVTDTVLLRKLVQNEESLNELSGIEKKDYAFFLLAESVFGDEQMLFWSSQNIVPPKSLYGLPEAEYFKKLDNGYYVIVKKGFALNGMTNRLWAYAMIPVKSNYYIENEYLTEEFAYRKNAYKRVVITNKESSYPIKSSEGNLLFYIDRKTNSAIPYNDNFTIILRLLAICVFFVFVHNLTEYIGRKRGKWMAVLTLIILLSIFRFSLYFFPEIFQFRQFELFDPSVYGANFINRSLGDLLINSLLFSWITVFAWSKLGNRMDLLRKVNRSVKWLIGVASLLFLVLSTFELANTIKSLVADSKISFDVNNFFSLDKYSIVGFIVLASLSLGYYYFTQLMFRFILPVFEKRKAYIYFGIALIGLIYLSFRSGDPVIQFYLPVLLWLVCYTWLVSQRSLLINRFRINVAGMLFWIFIFCISIASIILTENKMKEWETRGSMAENLAFQNDLSNERLLSVAITYLDNKFLSSNFYRFSNEESSKILRDSILTENYKGYLNKYDTKLYVFDSSHNGLYNDDLLSYEALNNIITVQSKPSKTVQGLYSYVASYNKITYITRRIVTDSSNRVMGTVFILSYPKKSTTNALEATLFKEP